MLVHKHTSDIKVKKQDSEAHSEKTIQSVSEWYLL